MGAIVKLFPVARAIGHLGWGSEVLPLIQPTKNNLGFQVKGEVIEVGGTVSPSKSKSKTSSLDSPVETVPTTAGPVLVTVKFPPVRVNRYEAFVGVSPEAFNLANWSLPSIFSTGYEGPLVMRGQLLPGVTAEDVRALSSHLVIYLVD